jgi:hypothetical protein
VTPRLPAPATGPMVWERTSCPPTEATTHELTASEVDDLDTALRRMLSQGRDPARLRSEQVTLGSLANRLEEIGHQLIEGAGYFLLRGIPVERYTVAEAGSLLCGIGSHLGRLMPQDASGAVVHQVRDAGPVATSAEHARGYQGGAALPFHSDSCDVVGLLCLNAAQAGGLSAVTSACAVHNALRREHPDLLRVLYEPFCIDRHGAAPAGEPPYYATPVFMRHAGRLFSRFNPGYVYSAQRYPETPRLTERQTEALNLFHRLCASARFRIDMQFRPGDLQLLNNNVLVHARSAYHDHLDAARKRHLLRLWLFTSALDDLPGPMRDRYRDLASWRVNAHLPELRATS